MYDLSGLTFKQKLLLTLQGWHVGSEMLPQPKPETVKKLIERGLVIPKERLHNGVKVIEYEVPLDVHAAWCEVCSMMDKHA